ncbi:MAG: ATPase domain-containing protein [Candidatus Nezhaarchaeales archaeon]
MPVEMVKSGIDGFDEAFGGLYRGQIILVYGNAGSGKTTFCAKFLYEGAKRFKEPGVFLSNVESKSEFYTYMKNLGMDFEALEKEGLFRFVEMLTPISVDLLNKLSEELIKNVLELKAKRVVIDSITPFLALSQSLETRAILHNAMKTLARKLGVILLVTAELPLGEEKLGHGVEEFIVDGIIRLRLEVPEAGAPKRIMEVLKLRGRPLARAHYEFEIEPGVGLKVHLAGALREFRSDIDINERISTGIREIDEMLGGGIIRNTITVVAGPPGSGKTIFLLTLAAEATLRGEKVFFITFEEPRQQILSTLEFLGYQPNELLSKGLEVLSVNPRAISLREIYGLMYEFSNVAKSGGAILIVDGINAIRREFGPSFHRIFRDFSSQAKEADITLVLSVLKELEIEEGSITYFSTLADNIIEFRIMEENNCIKRKLLVRKTRMSTSSSEIREIKFENGKLRVV